MSIKLKPIEEAIEHHLVPKFRFLDENTDSFKLLRLQCKGALIADAQQGARLEDVKSHNDLCKSTLHMAYSNRVDILMTPEYSFPMELVDDILTNPGLKPRPGALWCLACQGVSWDYFIDCLGKWGDFAYVVQPSVANYESFVNVLLYVFQSTQNGKLVIIPQLKIQPMRDINFNHEGSGLTTGDVIYQFGREQPNQLCSIICADAYHNGLKGNLNIFNQNHYSENWIILHPQLNPKPRDDSMISFRKELFNATSTRPIVYITANWSAGTTIKVRGQGNFSINNPWTCIYSKHQDKGWLEGLRSIREKNLKKGLGFSYLNIKKTKIWHAVKMEHLQQLDIQKPNPCGHPVANSDAGVGVEKIYIPNANHTDWIEEELTFDLNLPNDLVELLSNNFAYPLTATVEQRDKFFGLCLGHLEKGQLIAVEDKEQNRRLSIHIDPDCDELRNNDAENVAKLTAYLQNPIDGLPGQLGHMNGEYKYYFTDSYEYYNLFPLSQDGKKAVWVTYKGTNREAKSLAEDLKKIVGLDREDKICVFTHNYTPTFQIDYYPKVSYPKYDVQINASKRPESIVEFNRKEDINNGRSHPRNCK